MVKKIICLLLLFLMVPQADAHECPMSITSNLQEAGSHLYGATAHAFYAIKHVYCAGEKSICNTVDFVKRYPMISCFASGVIATIIIKHQWSKKTKCKKTCYVICRC